MAEAASVITYSVAEHNAEELRHQVEERILPAAQETPGYEGFLLLDLGDGKRMAILLYGSKQQVALAQQLLTPLGEQFTYHLMSGPAVGVLASVLVGDLHASI